MYALHSLEAVSGTSAFVHLPGTNPTKCAALPSNASVPHFCGMLMQNEYAALFVALIGEGPNPQVSALPGHFPWE